MVSIPTHREPTHAGEMLLLEFLEPMHLTQREKGQPVHFNIDRWVISLI